MSEYDFWLAEVMRSKNEDLELLDDIGETNRKLNEALKEYVRDLHERTDTDNDRQG